MLKIVTVALALACTGCGTVVNLAVPLQENRVYGGLKNDVDLIEKIFDGPTSGTTTSDGVGVLLLLAIIALPFVDLPLSAIGDTLTLPITRMLDK